MCIYLVVTSIKSNLVPFTSDKQSNITQFGIAGTMRSICATIYYPYVIEVVP